MYSNFLIINRTERKYEIFSLSTPVDNWTEIKTMRPDYSSPDNKIAVHQFKIIKQYHIFNVGQITKPLYKEKELPTAKNDYRNNISICHSVRVINNHTYTEWAITSLSL